MSANEIPVAVIGLGGFGQHMLRALLESEQARVVGVADRDSLLAEQVGREVDVPHYDDYRQMLMNEKPQAAFLSIPPMHAGELLDTCAQQGVAVWKDAPLARDLTEAWTFVQRFEKAQLPFAVGTQRRFAKSYQQAFALRDAIGEVFLARGQYLFNWGGSLGWRGDRASAGGGALLELAYHPLDLLVGLLGLPEDVYGVASCHRLGNGETPQPQHDTDDTASAILRYEGCIASLTASRVSGPVSESLSLHGREGSILADGETCTLYNPNGDVLEHLCDDAPPRERFRQQAEAFLQAVANKAERYPCSAAENLLPQAVIEAIYLSGRTNQPESPLRQIEMQGATLADCLRKKVMSSEL